MSSQPTTIALTSNRLTSQDASFIYGESNAGPLHIGSVLVAEGEIPWERMVAETEKRLNLIPRYRQRLAFVPWNLNHARWVDDTHFDIRNHMHVHDLPRGSSLDDAIARAVKLFERPLDRTRPLWEIHLLRGVAGKSVLLMTVHHCMIDGASGVELQTVIFDLTPEVRDVPEPQTPWQPAPPPDLAEMVTDAIQDATNTQFEALRRAQRLMRSPAEFQERTERMNNAVSAFARMTNEPVVVAPWNQGIITQRRHFAYLKYPFADFRHVRGVLGGTVNDVVLAMLSEGTARYLRDKGFNGQGVSLRIGCPVNVRREGETGTLGNRVSMMYATLPAWPMDAKERMTRVTAETLRSKEQQLPQGLELLMEMSEAIPPTITGMQSLNTSMTIDFAARAAGFAPTAAARPVTSTGFLFNFVATNVPGVQIPLYALGCKLTDMWGLIALGGNLGLGITILSYNQAMYFGFMAEPRLMADLDSFRDHVDDAFQELLAAAGGSVAANTGLAPERAAGPATQAGNGRPLDEMTKEQLYALAQDLDVAGRGTMLKSELVDAIRAARA